MRKNGSNAGASRKERPPIAGLLGLGSQGQRLLRALPAAGIEVKWLCDLNPQRLERAGQRHPNCARTDRLDPLLDDDELDAVLIATPALAHLNLAARALTAGKHVFIDEPLAFSAQGARGLLRLASAERRAVACGNPFLHSSPVRAIKELLDSREIGELFFVSTQLGDVSGGPEASIVRELGKRTFAMLLYWLEERPGTVRATVPEANGSAVDDLVVLNLAFQSGLAANVEMGRSDHETIQRSVLVGSERMAVYDGGDSGPVSFVDHGVVHMAGESNGDYRVSYRSGDVLSPMPAREHEPLERALEDFGGAIREDRNVVANVRLAKEVMQMVEAAEESLRRGGSEVPIRASRRSRRTQAGRGIAVG